MTDRILDIAENPAKLKVSLGRLCILQADVDELIVPLSDIAVLIVSHPQVSYSQAVLSCLMDAGGVFVTCDGNRMPNGMLLPIAGHHLQSRRLTQQIELGKPACKRLWKQLVQEKIKGQGAVLKKLHGNDLGLIAMSERVKSGDPDNLEAQAARKYWRPLFQDENFRRDQEAAGLNAQLNYGYGILRAIIARAVCGTGLHPSLGIHHKNVYNPFCLVDDLMEPYRPIVDIAVAKFYTANKTLEVDKEFKAAIIKTLTGRYDLGGEQRTLFDCAKRTASSLYGVMDSTQESLLLPELSP